MAISVISKLSAPILFVLILQATHISALQCYGCADWDDACRGDYIHDEFLVASSSVKRYQAPENKLMVDRVKEILTEKGFKFTNESYCVKWLRGPKDFSRDFMLEGPRASDLNEYGCTENDYGRFCFCNQDKCNNEPILQFNKSSDLECYECISNSDCMLADNTLPELLVNQTTSKHQEDMKNMVLEMIGRGIRMRPGPFCAKLSIKSVHGEEVVRILMTVAPEPSYLDKSGCALLNLPDNPYSRASAIRLCSCKQDKCNSGPIPSVNTTSALRCYGCIQGADKELSVHNREECLEETPPDELVVNEFFTMSPLDSFAENLTKSMVNSSELTKGPFCIKVLHKTKRFIFRYITRQGIDAKYLDEYGCKVVDDDHQICFCKEDKCNNGC